MAISKDETAIKRNTALFAELDSMLLHEQKIFYSEDHRIHDYLRAIRENYTVDSLNQFKCTLCTGALIVVKTKSIN